MIENFVLEMANGINEFGQQRINRLLILIDSVDRYQKAMAELFLQILEVQNEIYNRNTDKDLPVFEVITAEGDIIFADNIHITTPEGCLLKIAPNDENITPSDIEAIKNLKSFGVSYRQICPARFARRRLQNIICKKPIEYCDKCRCTYGGWDWHAQDDIRKIKIHPLGIKI